MGRHKMVLKNLINTRKHMKSALAGRKCHVNLADELVIQMRNSIYLTYGIQRVPKVTFPYIYFGEWYIVQIEDYAHDNMIDPIKYVW